MKENSATRPRFVVECVYYTVAIFFFLYLFFYFWTSEGGPTLLAIPFDLLLMPVALERRPKIEARPVMAAGEHRH